MEGETMCEIVREEVGECMEGRQCASIVREEEGE